MCHCHPVALCRKRRCKRIWHRLRPAYKWGPRALSGSYGFGSLCSRPALTRWCSGVTLGQAAEEMASSESCKKSHLGSPASLRSFFNLWLCLLWRTLPLPAVLSPFSSQLALPCSAASSCCLLKIEVQKPIYRTVFLYCSFQQRDGFQLLKSSNILEFVRHIWKLDTKNILVLKIPSLETMLPFLHDGYLSFYILSFDISCSLLKSLFEINHSRVLPKVCSILQMVAHSLASR